MSALNPKARPSPRGAMTPPSTGFSQLKSSSVGPPMRATRTPGSGRKQEDITTVPAKPKIRITAEQQLYIMDQIDNGNYNKDVGLEQWSGILGVGMKKPKCQQNLMSTFVNSTTSFSDTLTGANLNRKLFGEDGHRDSFLNPSICSTIAGDEAFELGAETNSLQDFEQLGDEVGLAEYRAKIYQLMTVMDKKFKICLETQKNKSETNLSKLFPIETLESLQATLSRVASSLEKFLDGNTSEYTKLFLQPNLPNSSIICPIEEHEEFIKGISAVSETLTIIDEFQKRDSIDVNCEKLLNDFLTDLDKFESELNAEEKASLEMKELQKQLHRLSLENQEEKEIDAYNTSSLSG